MNVNGKFTDIYSYTKKIFILMALLTIGSTGAWGQDYSGIYYIANDNSGGNNSGSTETTAYSNATDAIRWYLVPAGNSQRADKRDAYYSPNHANSNGDSEKPFLTTYQNNKDQAALPAGMVVPANNSVWIVKKTNDGYYNVIHAATGKYVIYEVPLPNDPNTNTNANEGNNGKRKTMHLQTPDDEEGSGIYRLSTNENYKFTISRSGTENNYIYRIQPIRRSGWYWNPANGNRNSYSGIRNGNDVYQAGLVGVYNKQDDGGSKWRFESALLAAPTINTTGYPTVTVTDSNELPNGYNFRYTFGDGTQADPTASSPELAGGTFVVTEAGTLKVVIERYGVVLTEVASQEVGPAKPTFNISVDGAVTISATDDIYYTLDGTTPTTSSSSYSSAISASAIASATGTAIKAITVDASGVISQIAELPLATYTYKIVNRSNGITTQQTVKQCVGKRLTVYDDIPADIRSPYLNGEDISFYTFSGDFSSSNLIDENMITKTPAADANIYVTYTTNKLSQKFLHLRGARPFNIKNSSNQYLYDLSGNLDYDTNDEKATENNHIWYFSGDDPYAVEVRNAATNKYLVSTPALSNDLTTFILTDTLRIDDDHQTITLKDASGTIAVTINEVHIPTSYYLIDKAGKIIFGPEASSSAEMKIPNEWKSPLVTRYHYYKKTAFNSTKITSSDTYELLDPAPAELNSLTELETGEHVYITYDVDPSFVFDTSDNDTIGTQAYMLKFIGGESFKQENGKDTLMTVAQKAVYPYSNGDACLYIYGTNQWNTQLASGASTRTRWLWHVVSPNSDPYHVKIMSHQAQASSHNYFRTDTVTYNGAKHVVTGVTTMNPNASSMPPTEYMILTGTNGKCKLVTVNTVNDGSENIQRTVTSFEQYWKNNPTIQKILGSDKVTDTETYSDNITLNSTQTAKLRSVLTSAIFDKWHSYKTFANAAPWVGWKTDNTGTGKQYKNKSHWFQTVDMGSTGEFDFEPVTLKPQVILIDQHGWEIMRTPLSDTETLRKYNSPMVKTYYWYPTASKVPGYHKYTVSNPKVAVYTYNTSTKKWVVTTDSITHTSTSLAYSPYDRMEELFYEKQDTSVMSDLYVTYDVKPEYANAYAGASTSEATSASPYLLKMGNSYAKIENNNLITTNAIPENLEDVTEDMQWYLKPNFDIDGEMGYQYLGEYDEKTKLATEEDYVAEGKNGFDPYNLQIQSVSNTARYFRTNTTSPTLSGGAWTGTSSTVATLNLNRNPGPQSAEGYDQTTLSITNTSFMVVDNGEGRMRLMPRFDNSKVVTSFTSLQNVATAGANTVLTIEMVPKVVDSSDKIKGMGGYYILANNFTSSSPIGTEEAPFLGTIDGKFHQFSLTNPLVAYAKDATIRNVILDNATISSRDTVGAIVCAASGNTRIYNCGILDGSVGGNVYVGGIVGLLEDTARVINCYSYATITGGEHVGGIVGYNKIGSTASNIQTMVMNCMFYGDITGGGTISPVYGGEIIDNMVGGLNTFNYYAYEKLKTSPITAGKYNCAQAVEERYLTRFELYRQLLNSNKRLAAYYITGDAADDNILAKWVLESADKSIVNPKPYPVLKPQGIYPSIINYDTQDLSNYDESHRNEGRKIGTLNVTISGVGDNAPTSASITNGSLSLVRTDKDYDHYNFNFDKVQLPYYDEVGEGNYGVYSGKSRVVTGWKITGMTVGSGDDVASQGSFTKSDTWDGYNFADRKKWAKDLYSATGRIYSQGAYFDVPYGVTGITIEPYWGRAVYVADEYLDVVHNASYGQSPVNKLAKNFNNGKINIGGSEQTVYTSISTAVGQLSNSTTVYDQAIVLVGNLHHAGVISNGSKAFTIMSVDLDEDHEPDYSMIFHDNARTDICPIRFDFLNIPGTAQVQKPRTAEEFRNAAVFNPKSWFEITNTSLIYFSQFEYENNTNKTQPAPLILLGGTYDQFVSTKVSEPKSTTYIHVGDNAWFKDFGNGTHSDGNKKTKHVPISVTGGEYEGFYLTGTYNANAAPYSDNAECYISGGHFVEAAGAGQEQINGNVQWQIYDADIDNFYGGGINDAKPITGTITTDIFNSHVGIFCGGPKFGNMSSGKNVTTTAKGCTFDKYFGAGYGGNSISKKKYYDKDGKQNWSSLESYYTTDKGKYFNGESTNADNSHADYGKKGPGVAVDFDYEFFVWTTGKTGARFFVKFAAFSLAQCNDVTSSLTGCTINKDFYGGGSLGNVTGTATSTLDGCTVHGNVFGGGYSASLPRIPFRTGGFTKYPNVNTSSGMFEQGVFSDTVHYEWKQVATLPSEGGAGTEDSKYIKTKVDFSKLGQVGQTNLTIKGNTIVEGKVFNEDEIIRQDGGVFGGGDESAVNGNAVVLIQKNESNGTPTINNVYGGGNTADVNGNTTVTMTSGEVTHDVYGGGKGETTIVGGNVAVTFGAKDGSGVLSGDGHILGSLYGGGALGDVNTSENKTTSIQIYGGTVNDSIFSGGKGQLTPSAIQAINFGDVTLNMEGGTVGGAIFGGSNINGVLKKKSTVTIINGTVGTVPEGGNPYADAVFGGGFGQPTLVEGDVEVNIGTSSQAEGGAVINGHIYGGGALGNVNTSKPESVLVFDGTKHTNVSLNKGTIHGNVYGGGLGQQAVVEPATPGIEAYVGGNVNVTLDGATLTYSGVTPTTGHIFGCNNLNGTPKGHVKVHVKKTIPVGGQTFDVAAVYGGGNEADYNPTAADSVEVIIEGCDITSIKDVYGGGNAAAVPAAEVWILGTDTIDNVFGGGNGELGADHAAHVGFHRISASEKSNYSNGTGKTYVKLVGGHINNVYGGSNSHGDIRGGASISMPQVSEYTATHTGSPVSCTTLNTKNIYGGGKNADMSGGTSIVLGCMPDEWIDEIYAGAQNADVAGDVSLTITSGKFKRVFGGNKDGGLLKGSITVNIEETGECETPIVIGELYGGGNLAGYSIYGYKNTGTEQAPVWEPRTKAEYNTWYASLSEEDKAKAENKPYNNPLLNVHAFTSIGSIFGGGYQAQMIANPHVDINVVKGSHAATARAEETIANVPIKKKNESTGIIEDATITLHLPAHEANKIGVIEHIFGGGNLATIDGDVEVNIGTDDTAEGAIITGNVYGGGNQAIVTGNTQVNICAKKGEGDTYESVTPGAAGVTISGAVFGAGKGLTTTVNNTQIVMGAGAVKKSVYGGGELGSVEGNTNISVMDGTIGDSEIVHGGAEIGNVYGGGQGDTEHVTAGLIKGNTTINISGGSIYHNIYGGGAYGSVGTYTYDGSNVITGHTNDTGIATITITGGTIGIDGHENGMIFGASRGDVGAPNSIHDKLAWVYDTHVEIGVADSETGPAIKGSIYGSGENGHTYNNAAVTIYSGTIGNPEEFYAYRGNVYGGGCGTDKYDSDSNGSLDAYNAKAGIVGGNASVVINGGNVANNVYGAGAMGKVVGNTSVTINTEGSVGVDGNHDDGNVYGAARGELGLSNEYASVTNSSVTITKGTVKGTVYGGGRAGVVTGQVTVQLNGGTILHDVYGGGALAQVNTSYHSTDHPTYTTNVNLAGTTVNGDVYGGGLGQLASAGTPAVLYADVTEYNDAKGTSLTAEQFATLSEAEKTKTPAVAAQAAVAANVNGPVTVSVTDGSATNVFGCNNLNGAPQTTVDVEIGAKSGGGVLSGSATVSGSVYGGGNMAAYTGSPAVKIYGGTVNTNVYGGGLGATAVTGGTSVTMEGGTVGNDVYGGGSQANVTGSVAVSIAGGTVTHDVYGGGALANTNTANWDPEKENTFYDEVSFLKVGESVVTGLYTKPAEEYVKVTEENTKAANGVTYYRQIKGGWASDTNTSTTYTTTVTLTGGIMGNAYGGGLGDVDTPVYIFGNVTVKLNEGVSDPTKGAAFTRETATNITVGGKNYPAIPLTGSIFGCNNINGTPRGDVMVEVFSTRQLNNAGTAIVSGHSPNGSNENYEVQAVYGGGNQADYQPLATKKTQVVIRGCDETSIEKVYGGGNSAAVPATDVTIWGTYDISDAFGGGNGSLPIRRDGVWIENAGSKVYGNTNVVCKGGKIGNVFGGSDAKGNVYGTMHTDVEHPEGSCALKITKIYGASKEADVDGDVNVIINGCSSDAIEYVCGGSYNANIRGDITLTITSGIFKNVYGGNDARGSIGGNITVNIQEEDNCKPIIIQNLVGGGFAADYPGLDTKKGGNAKRIKRDGDGKYITGEYTDFTSGKITVNVKSATRIDNIYGGGFRADVNGDTEVNINMIKGLWAGAQAPEGYSSLPNVHTKEYAKVLGLEVGTSSVTAYYEKSGDVYTKTSDVTAVSGKTYYAKVDTYVIDDAIGTIGNVYGGGNEGNVYGDAVVNIGTETEIPIMYRDGSGTFVTHKDVNNVQVIDTQNSTVLGAHITGNVFGGGNQAYVRDDATVNICAKKNGSGVYEAVSEGSEGVSIAESVYGGGNAADVRGNTNVTMSGGYVYDGVYGGGLMGSVGTFTRTTDVTTESNGFDHSTHTATCLGKPTACTAGGTCTVVISGGQIGPDEVALSSGGMTKTGGPVDVGFVFGAGRGEVEDPDVDKDADFHTYVNETYVTISGGLIMASVYGGGENGRVLNDTHVTINGGQIGCGIVDADPAPYEDSQFVDPTTLTGVTDGNALTGCSTWTFDKNDYKSYDPLANMKYSDGTSVNDASTTATDGNTYYGSVFGGGSGYYPYAKADGTHEWLRSAGAVYGNTNITITGGHILTGVYGGNEVTDVGTYTKNDKGYPIVWSSGGKCTINMSGGTVGVPRTKAQIDALPVSGSLFGAGKGDHRTHFNTWTNVNDVEVTVSGGIVYGSVFGGGEEGHVLNNAVVNISGTAKIGSTGTSGMDGNVFGGGRGYSGMALTAGSTGGNVTMNISGGKMLGSVYGGGRLASVGIGFTPPNDLYYGQLIDDKDENGNGTMEPAELKHGHITINISGGKIGKATVDEVAIDPVSGKPNHPVSGNVYGGSMGRITYLNGDRNPLWPKQAVIKESEITISGGEIMNSVYGGGEIGIVRNRATVNVRPNATPANSPIIHGNVFGGGYGSDDQDPTTISAGGYGDDAIYYTFTPMIWTGCVSGNTYVNISGGKVEKSVYGGGNYASVGLMNYNSKKVGETYEYKYIKKHDISNGFGLSWPYEFQYIQAAPKDDAPGGKAIGGKTTINITGGRIGTTTSTDNAGFVYGGSKGQVSFTKADNVTPITDIDEQVYAEAFSANVRETEVNINYDGSTPNSDDGVTTECIVRSVYGGGEDGHVMENAAVNLTNGWVGRSVFGGGKGASTYSATLLDPSTGNPKDGTEAVHSWTAGKVYGNTTVTVNGGKVGWFVYGGGNMASVGKGNYSGGADDYSTAGYGETLTGNLWTSSTEGDNAWHFLNSGKTTVNLFGGQVGSATVGFDPKDQLPYGSVFGGSRGTAAMDVGNKSPRYKYVPDFYLGYVNKTVVNIGGTSETGAVTGDGPTIYGSVYGGGQDGHVRNSTEVKIFKGSISGQTSDAAGRSGHVFGAGSGIGTYREDDKDKCSSSSGSVTCTALVEMNGGSIHGNIWGGGAMASVGPPRTGQPKNEQHAASDSHKSFSFTRVDVKGGSVGGSVYGASRGPSDAFLKARFADYNITYDKTKYATDIWSDVSVTGGTIGDNVYGGGQGGIVKESTTVSLTGGIIAHDAYGGGQGTDSIAADVLGNTTTELNKGKTVSDNGCIVEKVFGCNDLNGTPKGHVLVHIYATQHRDSTQIGQKCAKFKTMEGGYTIENYTADSYDDDLKSIAKKVLTPAEITTFETAISGAANDSLKRVALDRYIEAIADKKYDVLGVYGGGDLALYEPTDHSETTDVIIDGCDLTSIKQVYGGGNAASTPATHVRINAAYEIHETFGGGNGKDAYKLGEKWYENPGANVGYYATFHHDTSDPGKGSSQGNPYPAIANEDADTPEERHANTSYHYGTGTTSLEITGGRIHTTYGGSNTRGNVRAEAHTSTEDAGVCTMSIDASYPAGKTADTDATSKVAARCVEYQDAIYGGSYGANVYSDVVIDITNGTYGKIFGGNDRSGHIYGSITINVHEEGCKPIVIGRLYAGGNQADYSIYGFKDNGSARSKAEYDALSEVEKANITVRRDPQINIISATRIDTIYGGGYQAKLIGSPSINVNMENGFVAANYVKKKPADFTIERHEATDHGMDCSYTVEKHDDDGKAILAIGSIGNIYGGGFKGDVQGDTRVEIGTGEWLSFTGKRETTDADGKVYTYNSETGKWDWTKTVDETTTTGTVNAKPAPARNAATITGNVFGGGEGEAPESGERAFYCDAAMVGINGDGVAHPDGGTTVVIANGTVGTLDAGNLVEGTGNVYGGGELGRVEKNTVVTIGATPEEGETSANTKFKPTIHGTVFGAGKGVATHGYSALVRGNSTVTIQGFAKVERSVYGGGEKASIGRYHVAQDAAEAAAHGVEKGMPYSLLSDNSGSCTVIVKDSAEVGPNDMLMTRAGGPDDSGYIFGGGKGVTAYEGITGDAKPWRMTIDESGNSIKEVYNSVTPADTLLYLKYVESLGLATQTDVTVGGAAFIKGSVYGGAENGYVQHDTKVTIQDNCQIGNGYVQRNEAGDMLPEANRYSLNRRYTPTEWAEGRLHQGGESNYTSSLPECASWPYGQTIEYGGNFYTIYAPHDIFAVAGTEQYPSGALTYGGRQEASDGHTFYGNVFGGGSGYYPYATGKWHFAAGSVGGNTTVNITGGHILTNVYGGNEMTNVAGTATINFGGTATLGVPRTLGQIDKHPVTCYLFGAGKGDTRVFFNKQTNIKDAIVNITGGTIYGSVFGGGEDGHVMGNVNMDISGGQIGTWGTSYVDGNVFGGGRGFTGDAYTAGNVAGSVAMNISGGTMLGSIYGGGRLASVGYGLYLANETGYGEMRDDDKMDNGDTAPEGMFPKGRGHVEINISGGTIGNNNEYKNVTADGAYADLAAAKAALATWQIENKVPKTTYETIDNGDGTYTNRLMHTKGGNVYAGGMGRRENLSGAINHYAGIHWYNLGNVKSTKVTITGGHIKSNVYGGGEYGAVRGNHLVDGEALSTEINITGGTVGTEIVDAEDSVMYTFGSVFGGGTGTTVDVTPVMPVAHADSLAAFITDSTKVTVAGEAMVKASVYGGGEVCAVGGSTHVNISGNAQIGRNEVWPKDDPKKPGYVKFGSWRMGNVYGGGRGSEDAVIAGVVKGNTNVNISGGNIYHNVYGGGALGSVGTFFVSGAADGGTPQGFVPRGVPYWTMGPGGATGPEGITNKGIAYVTITGGTIGISGRDNGLVFGSSRGDISVPTGTPLMDIYDRMAWVRATVVNIGTKGTAVDSPDYLTKPLIKGSVYGGGENGHNYQNANVNVYSGTIGIAENIPGKETIDPWWDFKNDSLNKEYRAYRGNVYGAGSGSDTYIKNGRAYYNPRAGMIGGSTVVNIAGGHIGRSVYGAGAMASVGNISNANDTIQGGSAKHSSETSSFALSWPYKYQFAPNTGKATVNVTGGHIGTAQVDGGDVFGSARGVAGDRYETAHLAYVKEAEVNVNYPETIDMPSETAIQNDFTTQCITGSVHGSGEDGFVYGDTHVTLNKGLVGHSLYGGGKGKGTYKVTLNKIGGGGTYEADIYSLISGKVFGNTYVTMNDGFVGRNVYGGGNLASVGKGNYASGVDDYFPNGYGEKLEGNLWDNVSDYSKAFLSSGITTVKVFGGTVGYVNATDPTKSIKNNLPYGNVFGGSTGESAPNVSPSLSPRYQYCPAFFSGYVNETDVNIGGYRCKTAYSTHVVGELITAEEFGGVAVGDTAKWEKVAGPTILASVYGGGQDGHVRRDTHVTVTSGEIGLAFTDENRTLLKTNSFATLNEELDHDQWLARGNVYGAGSGISPYTSTLVYKDGTAEADKVPATGYSNSAGSVTRFTQVDILGGTIHRNVYGGGSMASIGPLKTTQDYDPYKKDLSNTATLGKQSMNIVNIKGTIGTPEDYKVFYGGEVYGASRGLSTLDANQFSTSIWTQVNVLKGAKIMGNVFGGGDAGLVKKDSEVIVGGQ